MLDDSATDPDRFPSIENGPQTELRIKGSRFLGQAFRVADEGELEACLAGVRRRHHAATHHCWATRTGPPDRALERCDDAGEPSGTAGRPMLELLRGRGLHEALVVVTRYFGGTKLGTGGLARAYSEAAALALDAASPRTVVLEASLEVTCDFADVGAIESVLSRAAREVLRVERTYAPHPRLTLVVPRSRAAALGRAIVEATAGRASVVTS